MPHIDVDLHISAESYLQLYQGVAKEVLAQATDGRNVRFPAQILRPYLLHDGIHGRFRILFDEQGRYQKIEKR
ncbi:DUF2835 domain-containing protein [Neptuniibacter sp. CAU 1671]|uniref:DUF2835 domain-containing protein n=1 Tax=Neptuniibacter sp. CAU 1671 TaxID=3032593 RepID=UPI0023DA83FC|nr:DUF2835 domain-containing protein [Neptuniibacter sp. CAU 1671]MDF2182742.1 DUF2835 domain-containing protein [Neptuniibacter sp. CAU 1671]